MPSMQLRRDDVIVGVDTHKDNHVAVAIDGLGGRLGDTAVPATTAGFEELLAFCLTFLGSAGRLIGFGIEGTGSYSIGLARYLRNQGHQVHEIARPARAAERRLAGKNDCAALQGPASLPPVRRGAPAVVVPTDPDAAMRHVLSSMAQRWPALHDEAKSSRRIVEGAHRVCCASARRGRGCRLRHSGADAHHRRRQHQPHQVRGSVRQDVRRLSDPGRIRKDQQSASPVPRWEPTGQRRALPSQHRAYAMAPADYRQRSLGK
jgi:transposase